MLNQDRFLIGGGWVASTGDTTVDVVSPHSEGVLAQAALGWLRLMHTGQFCAAQTRILAPRATYDLVDALVAMVDGIAVGGPGRPTGPTTGWADAQ